MRVAFIAVSQVPSRTANSIRVMKVCQAFSEIGHHVHLWLPRTQTSFDWAAARDHYGLRSEFPVTFLGGWPALRRWDASLRGARAAMRWGVVVSHVWPYQAAAFLSMAGRPTLLEVHDRPSGIAGPLLFRLTLRGRGLRRLLPITESLRVALERDYRVTLRPPQTVVLPSGGDIEAYADLPGPTEARARLGWREQFTAATQGGVSSSWPNWRCGTRGSLSYGRGVSRATSRPGRQGSPNAASAMSACWALYRRRGSRWSTPPATSC